MFNTDWNAFSDITVETDRTQLVTITIQFWKSWGGAENAAYAQSLILDSYPLTTFKLIADKDVSGNFIFTCNGKVVFDKLAEGKKNFKDDINDLICRIKAVVEA